MPQQHAPKLDRGRAEGQTYTHFLGPLNDGIRHNTVNANHCQQRGEPGESPNGGPVESGISKDFIQPLLHGLHAEYRNLRIQGLDSVADREGFAELVSTQG